MRAVFIIIALILASFTPREAMAQSTSTISENSYTYGDGSDAFVLRRSLIKQLGYDAVLQFSESNEIWTLTKSQGARGSVVYKNDMGRVFLRVNPIGSATLYPTPESMGIPVERLSDFQFETVSPQPNDFIVADTASVEEWGQVYEYAGNKIEAPDTKKDLVKSKIEFQGWPRSKIAYQNEIRNHVSAFLETNQDQGIDKVIVKIAEKPAALHDKSNLTIWVNPTLGYAGRPSTEKMLVNIRDREG